MSVYAKEADNLVARKSLLMLRFAMARMSLAEFASYQDEIREIDKRMSELRALIEAE